MSKQEKLIAKFRTANKQFKWDDLIAMLKGMGFEQIEAEGSRVTMVNEQIIIKLHKPHPQKEIKAYVIKQVKEVLTAEGLL